MRRSEVRHQGNEVCKKWGWGPLGLSLFIREEARSSTEFLKSQPSAFLFLPILTQKRNPVSHAHLIMNRKHHHMAGGS